jgi:hypothetical protein
MPKVVEPGHGGELVSLAGVKGRKWYGRQLISGYVTPNNTNVLILGSNPKRISAVIVNIGSNDVYLEFGETSADNTKLMIKPGGSFQIDALFPWTGQVNVFSAASNNVSFVEVEIT